MNKKISFPTKGGICLSCADYGDCPMNNLLKSHERNVEFFGKNYQNIRPDLWDEEAIDEPELDNGNVEWCPMYFRERTTEEIENFLTR